MVVYGILAFPEITSDTLISPTQEFLVSSMNVHTEQLGDLHSTGCLEAKSLNRFVDPLMWINSTLYLVAIERKVVTFGLALNFPWSRFL